ncbi:MAG: ABC transporter ATP-binding protein [Xanthobacteraceae bacterium]
MSDLELVGVRKAFADTVAVDNLSFRIEPGEFVAILGPSGCGKTTTLRLIAGFERPDAGCILIDRQDLTAVPPQRRNIGIVFQSYALFPHMTVAQNVAFGLEMRRVPRTNLQEAVAEALALVRLGELANRYSNQLSGGQQQRVALARALAIRPRLLLLDEPLSNLDAKLRDDMREEIRRIQRQVGITAVFVTHDQSEAFALADRVAVMDRGRLQQIAPPSTIYESPANATVASFIGQANVWDGTVRTRADDRIEVELSPGIRVIARNKGIGPGTSCRVFVKHEHIVLSRTPREAENCFAGRITASTYRGDGTTYVMTLTGDVTLRAVVPNRAGFDHFTEGDQAVATWGADAGQVFAA